VYKFNKGLATNEEYTKGKRSIERIEQEVLGREREREVENIVEE
jgi:hypothetical protein